ncbi:protein required for asparagine-linked oligosaccharide assembly [Scheffersomyces xylosifermentans]|uniref:protein required for asparagine-linked oligosaccharide assembly n=1 Tax=Scheffersomyces xylosifermentans TaxID=1304137 RepID=UPI00315D0748
MLVPVVIVLVAVVVFTYQFFTTILPRHFIVPGQNWREKIIKVIEYPKPIYLNVGLKRSSYRRRLILASCQPSFYTNFLNNKIKIQPEDAKNKNNEFFDQMKHRDIQDPKRRILYGFFHPYANNGGGGERVLWQAVKATLDANEKNIAVVYTTNTDAEPLQILRKAEDKFQIADLDSKRVVFIYLRRFGKLIDGAYWKHFTLIGQLVGSMLLALEALSELSTDVWVDTIGLPGSYLPVTFILKLPILAYVHYPIIQNDMFNKLKYKTFTKEEFSGFKFSVRDILETGKLAYWSLIYYFYVYLGSMVDIALANGTWTFNHINSIWSFNKALGHKLETLYPPCGTETLTKDTNFSAVRENKLLYIAQFRPEKRHSLFIDDYNQFLKSNFPSAKPKNLPTLVFLGSCRTPDDTATLKSLQAKVEKLNLGDCVEFVVDCSYEEVITWLSRAKFGLNAMWNEHFGIGVVEYLARGVIPLCHASAGPWLDIVTGRDEGDSKADWYNKTGYFFKSFDDPDFDPSIQEKDSDGFLNFRIEGEEANQVASYPTFERLLKYLYVDSPEVIEEEKLIEMRERGVNLVKEKFSNETFDRKWKSYVADLEELEKDYREETRDKVNMVY